jgi:hypothetical protein
VLRSGLVIPLLLLSASTAVPVRAATIVFYSLSDWEQEVQNVTSIDFTGEEGTYSSPLSISGVSFTNYSADIPTTLFVNDWSVWGWSTAPFLSGPAQHTPLTPNRNRTVALLPPGTRAVAADVMVYDGMADSGSVLVTLASSETETITVAGKSQPAFVGFVSDTPIQSIAFASTDYMDYPLLDNVRFGDPKPAVPDTPPADTEEVPEPGTWVSVGLALILCCLRLRR